MSYRQQDVNDPTLVSHWPLDETEGVFTKEKVGDRNNVVLGERSWQSDGGMVNGAIGLMTPIKCHLCYLQALTTTGQR